MVEGDLLEFDVGGVAATALVAELFIMGVLMALDALELTGAILGSRMAFLALFLLFELEVEAGQLEAGVFLVIEPQFFGAALGMTL